MADETQTQDTTEGGLAALPSGKGINIAGQKGVNLGAEQSSAIRDRLMQMIAEREGYNSSWQRIGELGALAAAPIGGYSAAYDQYAARGRQRDKDLIELQMGVGQLDTQQAQLKQQAEDNKFYADMLARLSGQQKPQAGGLPAAGQQQQPQQQPQPPVDGVGPMQPQAGGLPAAQVQGAPGALPGGQPAPQPVLTPEQAMVLSGPAYRSNPLERSKELARMINQNQKPTDLEQEVRRMFPNDPEAQRKALAAVRLGSAFQETTATQTEGPGAGYKMPTTPYDLVNKRLNLGGAKTPPATPTPTTPTATVPGPAAAPSAAVVNPTASPNIGAGDGAGAINVPNPHPVGSDAYVKFREDLAKKEMEVQAAQAQKVAETDAKELANMSTTIGKSSDRKASLDKAVQNLEAYPQMFGRLMRPTATSAVMNALSQGVTVGRLGAVGFPGVNELSIQMDPTVRKDPKAISAWNETVATINEVLGDYTAITNQGQGSVSDQERQLYRAAVADPTKMDAPSLKVRMLATRLNYQHTEEVKDAWDAAQKAGMRSYQQFKATPAFKDMQKRHFYETAKVLGVKGANWKQDVGGGSTAAPAAGDEAEAARLRAELRGNR